MLSNISDLFTMASLVICMLLSGIIFYYLRTRISMLEQSVMDQAQLLQQVVTSLKSSQYRQQQMNSNVNAISVQQHQDQDIAKSSEMKMNLIQVSDDSDSDDSDDSSSDGGESSDSHHSESDDDDESGNVCTLEDGSCSKVIDLSMISSSANYLKPSSHSEIKVIELKSNIRSNDYIDNNDNSSDDDEDEDDEDYDEDEDDNDDDYDDDEDDDGGDNHHRDDRDEINDNVNGGKNDNRNRNENENLESKNNDLENQDNVNVNIKKKSIVIEDLTNSVSLDEMKHMPVNSLRSLAKNKLSNIDVPTINKMSKKDILKALHE